MANDRLEELRQRAHERIQQVREAMERGEDVSPSAPEPELPRPASPRPAPAAPEVYQPEPSPQSLEGQSLEGASLEGAGLEELRPQPALRQERGSRQDTPAAPRRQQAGPSVRHRGREHRSVAARVLSRETLRQAILAQEILGKPLSLRPPRETEDL